MVRINYKPKEKWKNKRKIRNTWKRVKEEDK